MDAYQRVIGSIAAKSLMLTSNLKHKVAVPVSCIAPMVHYTNKVTKNGYEGSSYIRSTGSLKDFKLASLVSSYVMLRLLEQINASVLIQYTAKFCHFPDELFARHSNNAIAYFKNISRQQLSQELDNFCLNMKACARADFSRHFLRMRINLKNF